MIFSKTLLIRFISIAGIIIVCWTLWKRIDAIIDNYKFYYDVALMQKIYNQEEQKFNQEMNKSKSTTNTNNTSEDWNKKWEEYQKQAPFPAENKPVPAMADEYTKGYYHGLWNFFITSGFATIFAALIIFGSGAFLIRLVWNKITDQVVEKIFSKF